MASTEVTISAGQGLSRQISEVARLLETHKEATISAINLAIPSAVNLVELVKHKIKGLHQVNKFERVPDSNKTRVVIKLSLKALDSSEKGYQAPIPDSQVTETPLKEMKLPPRTESRRPAPRGTRRGGFSSSRGVRSRGRPMRGGGRAPRSTRPGEPEASKYVRAPKQSSEANAQPNEVLINAKGRVREFVKAALLNFKKSNMKTVVLKASGTTIPKAVAAAEQIKTYEPGLHQINCIQKRVVKDVFKPIEEGLDDVVIERNLEGVEITLSKDLLDTKNPGFQPPISSDKVQDISVEDVLKF